ncbi:MAG: ABC transporter ATP-binding protein [Opitutales bacterium]
MEPAANVAGFTIVALEESTTPPTAAPEPSEPPRAPEETPNPLDPAGYIAPPPEDHGPAIEVKDLRKRYGKLRAIDGVSFTVRPGEIIGFLGPNGAGKSTTMRILTGLQAADSGEARVAGFNVATDPQQVPQHVGFMSENNPLPEDLRVGEYLCLRAKLKGLRGRRRRQREEEVKRLCELDKKTCRKLIGSLSKGFRQRVGIADVLLAEPQIVIMDEPTIGLDPHQIRTMRKLIRSLKDRMTVILSSHILPEIEACCDRVIIINHGRIVACNTPAELRREFIPERTFRLLTDAPPEALAELCDGSQHPFAVETEGKPGPDGFRQYHLTAPNPEDDPAPLLASAQAKGWQVREAALLDPTLEQVFVAATRKSWKDEENAPEAA